MTLTERGRISGLRALLRTLPPAIVTGEEYGFPLAVAGRGNFQVSFQDGDVRFRYRFAILADAESFSNALRLLPPEAMADGITGRLIQLPAMNPQLQRVD